MRCMVQSGVSRLLFGRRAALAAIIPAAGLYGFGAFFLTLYMPAHNPAWGIPALSPSVQIAVIAVLWFSAAAVRAVSVVRNPRETTSAFVYGVTYAQRCSAAAEWAGVQARELALFGLIAGLILEAGTALILGASVLWDMVILGGVILALSALGYGATAALRREMVKPFAHDRGRVLLPSLGSEQWRIAFSRGNLRVSRAIGGMAKGMTAVHLRRLLLYIGRCDPVMFAGTNLLLPVIGILLAIVTTSDLAIFPALGMLALVAAALGGNIDLFVRAARLSTSAPYYPQAPNALFAAHFLFAVMQTAAYWLAFVLVTLIVNQSGGVIAVISFTLALLTLCLLASSVYIGAGADREKAPGVYGGLVFVTMAGAAIPIWGWTLFAAVWAFVYWSHKNFVRRDSSQDAAGAA